MQAQTQNSAKHQNRGEGRPQVAATMMMMLLLVLLVLLVLLAGCVERQMRTVAAAYLGSTFLLQRYQVRMLTDR